MAAPAGRGVRVTEDAGEQQIPCGNDNKKGKCNSKGKGKCNSKGNSKGSGKRDLLWEGRQNVTSRAGAGRWGGMKSGGGGRDRTADLRVMNPSL